MATNLMLYFNCSNNSTTHATAVFSAYLQETISLPTHNKYVICLRNLSVDLPIMNVRREEAYVEYSIDKGKTSKQFHLPDTHVGSSKLLIAMLTTAMPDELKEHVHFSLNSDARVNLLISEADVQISLSEFLRAVLGFKPGVVHLYHGSHTAANACDLFYKYRQMHVCLPSIVVANNMHLPILRTVTLDENLFSNGHSRIYLSFLDDFYVPMYASSLSYVEIEFLDCLFEKIYLCDLNDIPCSFSIDLRQRYVLSL